MTDIINSFNQQISPKSALQKFNISPSEHNKSFSHTPQVRSAGFADVGSPISSLRGTQLNVKA